MKTFALLALTAVQQASAFWGKGHLLVARQAESILESEAPDVLEMARAELSNLQKNPKAMVVSERDHPFTECATFADEIKDTWGAWQTPWHFIDQPYLDEAGTTLEDFDFEIAPVDVIHALTDLSTFLKGEGVNSDSQYVKAIAHQFPELDDQRSFALRLVIHYLGDIHQPLHGVSMVDHRFSEGDMGGNAQKIPLDEESGVGDLHAIWDSVIFQYPGYETLPLNQEDWGWFSNEVIRISADHPIDQTMIKPGQFKAWAEEDLALAIKAVYEGFTPNEVPTEEYRARALPLLETRMMYGAARLAELVKDIYAPKSFLQ